MLRAIRQHVLASAAVITVILAGMHVAAIASTSADEADLYVAPGGKGDCSQGSPCGSFDAAFARAGSGMVIQIAGGTYPSQTVRANAAAAADFADNVVVRPAPGADVTVAGVQVHVPHLTVRGMRSTSTVYFRPGASHSRMESMHLDGASAYVTAADNVALVGNRIEPPHNNDGLQVKGLHGDNPDGLSVDGNTIGRGVRTDSVAHVDCIQFLGGDNAVVRNNVLFDCASAGVHVGNGAGGTVGRILFERNFMRECTPQVTACPGYHAMIIDSSNAGAVQLIHNSIAGSVMVSTKKVPDADYTSFVAKGNIADDLPCTANVNGNFVLSGGCGPDDLVGAPTFADVAGAIPDLHLVPDSPGIDVGSPVAPTTDIDGDPICGAADVGADEVCDDSSRGVTTPTTTTTTTTTTPTTTTAADATATTATATLPTTEMVTKTFSGGVHSKMPTRGWKFVTGTGLVTADLRHSPYAGVSSGSLVVKLLDADGKLVATGHGSFEARLQAIVPAGTYHLEVTARPGVITAAVTHPVSTAT